MWFHRLRTNFMTLIILRSNLKRCWLQFLNIFRKQKYIQYVILKSVEDPEGGIKNCTPPHTILTENVKLTQSYSVEDFFAKYCSL